MTKAERTEIRERYLAENVYVDGRIFSPVTIATMAISDIPDLLDAIEEIDSKYQCNLEELILLDRNSAAKDKEYQQERSNLLDDRDIWKSQVKALQNDLLNAYMNLEIMTCREAELRTNLKAVSLSDN